MNAKLSEYTEILSILGKISSSMTNINVYSKETKTVINSAVSTILALPRTNGCWISYVLTKKKKSDLPKNIKMVLSRMISDYENYTKKINTEMKNMEFKTEAELDAKAAEAWMEKNYPAGTECYLDDNICECEKYTIGEKRCSCGNRRISAFAEYIGDEFYLTLEGY